MTRDEIDAFFAAVGKRCPAEFEWPVRNLRRNERRARQPVEVGGSISKVEIEIVIRMNEPGFIVIVLLAPTCITRLCLGSPHYDNRQRTLIESGHLHPWENNRPKGARLPEKLSEYELLPAEVIDRDAAFAWFLQRYAIESTTPEWPDSKGMF